MKNGGSIRVILLALGVVLLGSLGITKGLPASAQTAREAFVRASNIQDYLEEEPLFNPFLGESQATVSGKWFARWRWMNGPEGESKWTIREIPSEPVFIILGDQGEVGNGVTYNAAVFWVFTNTECKEIYFGFLTTDEDFMSGGMICRNPGNAEACGSCIGTWDAELQ